VERRGRSIDDGLDDVMRAVCDAPKDPERLLEHILEQVVGSGERGDDIAVLAVRFLPVAPRPLELRVRSNVQSMDVVRDALRAWLEGAPLDRSGAEDVVLATWEACANAIEHAVDPAEDVVSVCAELASDRVRISVADTGTWAPPSGREDRGFGLRLMGSLSTSVDVSRAAEGTTVTIEKTIISEHTAGD
jgi:anti-sigma regulatory factor (Ser/Thr protein kinase)